MLGYMTKSSIASIKNAGKLNQLENEYAKMRSNKPTEMFSRFPALKDIDYFTPGMKSIILDIAARFAPKPPINHLEKLIKIKVLRQAKKVKIKMFQNLRKTCELLWAEFLFLANNYSYFIKDMQCID